MPGKSGFTAESLEEELEEHLWCEKKLRLEEGMGINKSLLGESEDNQDLPSDVQQILSEWMKIPFFFGCFWMNFGKG